MLSFFFVLRPLFCLFVPLRPFALSRDVSQSISILFPSLFVRFVCPLHGSRPHLPCLPFDCSDSTGWVFMGEMGSSFRPSFSLGEPGASLIKYGAERSSCGQALHVPRYLAICRPLSNNSRYGSECSFDLCFCVSRPLDPFSWALLLSFHARHTHKAGLLCLVKSVHSYRTANKRKQTSFRDKTESAIHRQITCRRTSMSKAPHAQCTLSAPS